MTAEWGLPPTNPIRSPEEVSVNSLLVAAQRRLGEPWSARGQRAENPSQGAGEETRGGILSELKL